MILNLYRNMTNDVAVADIHRARRWSDCWYRFHRYPRTRTAFIRCSQTRNQLAIDTQPFLRPQTPVIIRTRRRCPKAPTSTSNNCPSRCRATATIVTSSRPARTTSSIATQPRTDTMTGFSKTTATTAPIGTRRFAPPTSTCRCLNPRTGTPRVESPPHAVPSLAPAPNGLMPPETAATYHRLLTRQSRGTSLCEKFFFIIFDL